SGTALFQNCTITGNDSDSSGGGIADNSDLTIVSSIVSGNTNVSGLFPDFYVNGTVTATASLIGSSFGVFNFQPDSFTSANVGMNPMLDPAGLKNNGGPTQTIALAAGSPAIDNGTNPAALNNDQRGTPFVRVSGPAPDIGAFEVQPAPAPVT